MVCYVLESSRFILYKLEPHQITTVSCISLYYTAAAAVINTAASHFHIQMNFVANTWWHSGEQQQAACQDFCHHFYIYCSIILDEIYWQMCDCIYQKQLYNKTLKLVLFSNYHSFVREGITHTSIFTTSVCILMQINGGNIYQNLVNSIIHQ